MKPSIHKRTLTLFFLLFVIAAGAQTNKFYINYDVSGISKRQKEIIKEIKKFRLIKQDLLNVESFRAAIRSSSNNYDNIITIPLEDGQDISFHISPVTILSEESSLIFSQIQTYSGISKDSAMKLRLTISQLGIMGTVSIKGERGIHYFTVLDNQQPDILISFNSSDVVPPIPVMCGTGELAEDATPLNNSSPSGRISGDCMLRTYRFAVAATGEYTQWAGGQANAAALITTTVNNVNEVYENDFTIHLSLVLQMANIFTDPETDPYSTTLDNSTLTQNNNTLNANTGAANYDVGMVFGFGWSGGIAGMSVTCQSGKGRGAGGLNGGFTLGSSGPIFDNIIAHEIGHQFSATHTMASNNGSCGNNIHSATGWEPGGGSTIMAYAGSCSGNAYQAQTDNYFHGGSIAQVLNFAINGNGKTCAVSGSSGNNAPVVTVANVSYNIPHSTPFILTANAVDADAVDMLTYNWEQIDAVGGTGTSMPPSSTAANGPLFRSFMPSASESRYYPRQEVLFGEVSGMYEVLPRIARVMNFKVTVRDNHNTAGCTAYENVRVNVQNCGAFEITNLTTISSFTANGSNTMTLTWNTASCVAMSNIDVLFSTDGGLTYPHTILTNTPNDGSETFTVPGLPTAKGRFMIKSKGNIYFNINTADVVIEHTVLPAELLNFNAAFLNSNQALLSWQVFFEYDVRTYIAERSIDGVAFAALGDIAPFNHNAAVQQSYSYTDESIPANASKIFYRLKIEDIDGKIEYSSIVSLQLNRRWSARIYPNPIQRSSVEVFIEALSSDNTLLQVLDVSGRVIINKQTRLNKGSNKILMPVHNLSNGTYLLRIKGQTESAVLHFIKR